MTADQTKQWNDYACMSRALIFATAFRKLPPLTEDQFRAKYENAFPNPKTQYGGLILSRFYWIAKDIGLGQDMDFRCHFEDVKREFDAGRLVFVLSGVHLHQGRCDPFNHTSVLTGITDATFSVDFLANIPKTDWDAKKCDAIVFF